MIGDGMNDILSLKEAVVGVSINAKSELNLLASDVVVLNENLWKIASLFKLIKYARIFIGINLTWAFAYNIFVLPLSAGVYYSFGFVISPTVASAVMIGSDVMVAVFSSFMRCFNFDLVKENKLSYIQDSILID